MTLPAFAADAVEYSVRSKIEHLKSLTKALETIPEDYFELSERELERLIRKNEKSDTKLLWLLRVSFWKEYTSSCREKRPEMIQENIHRGICSENTWRKVLKDPLQAAYILTRPHDEMMVMREMHQRALKKVSEVIDLPLIETKYTRKKGEDGEVQLVEYTEVNTTLCKLMLTITRELADRVHGSVIQRQQIHQHHTGEIPQLSAEQGEMDMQVLLEMEKRVAKLSSELARLPGAKSETIEAEVDDE